MIITILLLVWIGLGYYGELLVKNYARKKWNIEILKFAYFPYMIFFGPFNLIAAYKTMNEIG